MVIRSEKKEMTLGNRLSRDYKLNKWKYVLILPVLVYLALFAYKPMYGLVIAFKNYKTTRGFAGSDYVGLMWFRAFSTIRISSDFCATPSRSVPCPSCSDFPRRSYWR